MKSKKVLIGLICTIVIVSIFIIIYINTDMFKTKEQLFWKYFLKEKEEIVSCISNDNVKNYNNSLKESSYIKEGTISINSKLDIIKPIEVSILKKGNNKEKYNNAFINFSYDNQNIGEATIIKDDNYYLIRSNLLDDKYIGFENNNLKEVASSIGIKNTNFIPDSLNEIDYSELFTLTDEEITYILRNYIPIYMKHIKNKDYIKHKNINLDKNNKNVTAFELQLSEKQLNDFAIDVLNKMYEDEESINIISNKVKLINNQSEYCNSEKIKDKIKELKQYLSNKDNKEEKFLSIIIYKNENNVIKTEIVLKDDRTFSIEKDKEKNKIIIKQYDVKNSKIDLKTPKGIFYTILNSINEITYSKDILNDTTSKVDVNIICSIGIERITINYNYVEEIEKNVENIIRKKDVEYIELKNIGVDVYKNIMKKLPKISLFGAGKNY